MNFLPDHLNDGDEVSISDLNSSEDDDTSSSTGLPSAPKYARLDGHDEAGASMLDPSMSDNKQMTAKVNHSEIERRRRNKMTHYVNELAEMVPQCATLGRKPDKLTILRMAVSHMKSIRGTGSITTDGTTYRPSFLTDQELKHLILEAANGFLFVVACDSGKVIYVADSITPVLSVNQTDWVNNSIFDLIHPEDVEKVREQLTSSETASMSNNRYLDMKNGAVKKENGHQPMVKLHLGSRRGFICRMRLGNAHAAEGGATEHAATNASAMRFRNKRPVFVYNGQTFVVVHCTGYIRNCLPQGLEHAMTPGMDPHGQINCLVCIGRLQLSSMTSCPDLSQSRTEFVTRHSQDGKFSFVGEGVTGLLGYKPCELLGKTWSESVHPDDRTEVQNFFEQLLKTKEKTIAINVRFQSKSNDFVPFRTSAYTFTNPYSDEFEYVVASHICLNAVNAETNRHTTMDDAQTYHRQHHHSVPAAMEEAPLPHHHPQQHHWMPSQQTASLAINNPAYQTYGTVGAAQTVTDSTYHAIEQAAFNAALAQQQQQQHAAAAAIAAAVTTATGHALTDLGSGGNYGSDAASHLLAAAAPSASAALYGVFNEGPPILSTLTKFDQASNIAPSGPSYITLTRAQGPATVTHNSNLQQQWWESGNSVVNNQNSITVAPPPPPYNSNPAEHQSHYRTL